MRGHVLLSSYSYNLAAIRPRKANRRDLGTDFSRLRRKIGLPQLSTRMLLLILGATQAEKGSGIVGDQRAELVSNGLLN